MEGNELVKEYIYNKDWQISENANVRYSAQGLNLYLSGILVKDFWLKEVYPKNLARGHREGYVHIHNLKNSLTPYCMGFDLADLLIEGYGGIPSQIKSRPPKHLSTALLQLANFLYSAQNDCSGAVAVSNWDTLLSPFIRADKLSYEQVRQAVQEFIFNMNIAIRTGGQTVFSNITLDILPTEEFAKKRAIVGGEPQNFTYGDLQEEREMLLRALFEVLLEGDASGRPFTFPLITIDINHDFPYDAPYLELMWEATAKYGIPNFANYVSTGRSRDEIRSMCCRLQLNNTEIKRKGGVFAAHPQTGSIGVISINLPRIAIEADNEKKFIDVVQFWCREAIDGLKKKKEFLEGAAERGLYPFTAFWLRGIKEKTGKYWSNHFLTIGPIGAHEACLNLGIKGGITSKEGRDLALQVLRAMLEVIQEYPDDLVNLEAPPGEGSSHRLALIDKKKFGDRAKHSGPPEAPYYTSSTLYPNVDAEPLDVIEHQEPLQSMYTGGTVFHVWLGERAERDAVKAFVRKIVENTKLPYFTITPTFSVCKTHGYIAGEKKVCPSCGSKTEVYTRVVGYLRSIDQFNPGKRAEAEERRKYKLKDDLSKTD